MAADRPPQRLRRFHNDGPSLLASETTFIGCTSCTAPSWRRSICPGTSKSTFRAEFDFGRPMAMLVHASGHFSGSTLGNHESSPIDLLSGELYIDRY